MQPMTTSTPPAIINQCGNFNVATIDGHTISAKFLLP